jgi:hypothetical protein
VLACGFLAGQEPRQGDRPPLATPAPVVRIRPERVSGLESYDCTRCHAEVVDEWAASAHGLAWVDEAYQKDIGSKKRPELCHGCHVPEPLLAGELSTRPDSRDAGREHGVSCESCHQDESGAQLGPRGTPTEAHASKVSEHMKAPGSSALCAACHATNIGPVIGIAKDALPFLEARGLSCVGCHMAPVERSWAKDASAHTGRSHALQTPRDPAFLRLAFKLSLGLKEGKSVLTLHNEAGHRVPGLVGRELVFRAELRDAAGNTLERQELKLDERAYLPLDATREIKFTKAGTGVRVLGLHKDPRAAEPMTFLDETLAAN